MDGEVPKILNAHLEDEKEMDIFMREDYMETAVRKTVVDGGIREY